MLLSTIERCSSSPLIAVHRSRPISSQPVSDLASPNVNNTRKTTTATLEQRLNVRNLFMKRNNILHSSNSANTITITASMRPLSSSVKTYSKYQLKRRKVFANSDITDAYAYTPLFTDREIDLLFKAKCKDLNISYNTNNTNNNSKARLNFINALELCIKDRTLDLTAFNIGIHFIKALRHVFTLNTVLRNAIAVINLSKNPIGDTALKHVMHMISLSTAITHVDLSNTNISHKKADMIFTALERHSSLISLDVSSKDSTYRNRLLTSAMTSASRMLTHNSYLEYIDVSGNAIRDEGFTMIMRGISSNLNAHVVMLNVSHNDITNNGVKCLNAIGRVLPLEQLHLSNNPIKSDGIITICNNVSCCIKQLNKLYVSECGIDFNGFTHVVQTYAHGVHRLHTLVLDNNALNSNKRFETLREPFKNFNICNLSLRNCAFSAVSASYIADFLKANDIVRSINLSSNNITDSAFNAFAALPQCTRVLEKIDVSCNLLTNASAIPFVTALIDNSTLREVNLSNNQIRNETACALLKTLERNVRLLNVNLGMNFIKSEVVDEVNALLKRNRKLCKGRYVPQLKATIRTSRIDQGVYALFKGQIALSEKQRVKLKCAVKEDEERYESMKMKLRKELNAVLARVNEVDREIRKVNDDVEVKVNVGRKEETEFTVLVGEMKEKLAEVSEDVKRLEKENGRLRKDVEFNVKDYKEEVERRTGCLKMIREKNKITEMNVKCKLKELQQKKDMLKNSNSDNMVDSVSVSVSKSITMISGETKLHVVDNVNNNNKEKGKKNKRGVSAKDKASISKTKKKKKSESIIINPKKHKTFSVLPLNNNLYKVEYDTTLKRTKQHEQHIIQRSRMEWNSTSISKYGETDLTSPKHSLLNTVVSNN